MPSSPDPQPSEMNTRRLAREVVLGEPGSFQPLYERVAPSLFAWARLNVLPELRKRVDPQDLTQEVWMRAFSSFARFDPAQGTFRAWLFGVAKLVLLEGLRNARRGGDQAGSAFDLAAVPEGVTAISRRLARDESIERFLEYVATLERADRDVLVYLGLEGMRAADAAERLGLAREALIKRWQRLRARLREQGLGADLLED